MINRGEILQTIEMIDQQHLDVRTVTMGISLLDCCDPDPKAACRKIYDKITRSAKDLVKTGEDIEAEFGIPIVNKRISVTPIALVAGASDTEDYVPFAKALDAARAETGVNFVGGFSALVQKGMTPAEVKLIRAIPEALAETELVCSSVNIGSTKAGINMDAVALMGETVKETARLTADRGGFGCAKLVVFCNAVEDNPFMAGAFHGVSEPDRVINVGVSGPGVVHHDHQKDGLPGYAHGPARGAGGVPAAGRAFRHSGPLSRADPGNRRLGGADTGGDGPRGLRHPRHDGCAGAFERRGQEGRSHGVLLRRRALGRVHTRL